MTLPSSLLSSPLPPIPVDPKTIDQESDGEIGEEEAFRFTLKTRLLGCLPECVFRKSAFGVMNTSRFCSC